MDLSIRQLRMLREVSRRGTIAAAADHLGYTASAVSQQLSSAEKSTGVAMLDRVGRNVMLTDAGRELVTHADLVLEQLEHAQAAIERVQGEVSGDLHLGFIESVGSTLLGPIMKELKARHPALRLRTMGVDGLWPEELIRTGELDISFTVGSDGEPTVIPDGFDRTMVMRDWFRVVLPASHFGSKRVPKKIDLVSLAGEDFILPAASDACGRASLHACRQAGLDPCIAHRIGDYPTTLRLIGAEAGVALVPDLGLQRVPDDVIVADLAEPRYRTIELLYRRSSAQRPAVQAFIELVHDVTKEMELDTYDRTS